MSDISFNAIPSDVRVPLTYIEFDNSNAVSGTPAPRQRVLMFGQSGSKASAAPDVPVRIRSGSANTPSRGMPAQTVLRVMILMRKVSSPGKGPPLTVM